MGRSIFKTQGLHIDQLSPQDLLDTIPSGFQHAPDPASNLVADGQRTTVELQELKEVGKNQH